MRPRLEAAIAAAVVTVLFVVAGVSGRSGGAGDATVDGRASSFLTGPEGARALADVAARLGQQVQRWRERPRAFSTSTPPHTVFIVLEPARIPTSGERRTIAGFTRDSAGADLVLAGQRAVSLMRCFGFAVRTSVLDSSRVAPPGGRVDAGAGWVHVTLRRTRDSVYADSSLFSSEATQPCAVPRIASLDTILVTDDTALVMVRLHLRDSRQRVTLLSDASLLRNRVLRSSSTAPLVVDALIGDHRRLVFDEYHMGFGPGGSMLGVLLGWSRRNPVGWAVWQLAIVGVIALFAGGVRFGPVTASIKRKRRSPLEHVRALATALAAAHGHDVAIEAIVRGLRRRLTPPVRSAAGRRGGRDELHRWLDGLGSTAPTPRARERAAELSALFAARQPSAAVLAAATAVEDLWQELRP